MFHSWMLCFIGVYRGAVVFIVIGGLKSLWACVCACACCCVLAPPLGQEQRSWLVTCSCMDGDIWSNLLWVATEKYVSGCYGMLCSHKWINVYSLMNLINIVDAPNMLVVFSVNQRNGTSRTHTHTQSKKTYFKNRESAYGTVGAG